MKGDIAVSSNSTLPAAPTAPNLSSASDTGSSKSDNFTNDTTPAFTGKAEVGTTVELFADGISLGTTKTGSGGNWNFTIPDAQHYLMATS